MAQKARIHIAVIVQHVMATGNKGRAMFSTDTDRTTLPSLWRLAESGKEVMEKRGISDVV